MNFVSNPYLITHAVCNCHFTFHIMFSLQYSLLICNCLLTWYFFYGFFLRQGLCRLLSISSWDIFLKKKKKKEINFKDKFFSLVCFHSKNQWHIVPLLKKKFKMGSVSHAMTLVKWEIKGISWVGDTSMCSVQELQNWFSFHILYLTSFLFSLFFSVSAMSFLVLLEFKLLISNFVSHEAETLMSLPYFFPGLSHCCHSQGILFWVRLFITIWKV